MKLIHYTNEKFELEPRPYLQSELRWQAKPNGLWVSVAGDDDWKSWCEKEDYLTNHLVVSYEISLNKNANILHLKTPQEIYEFGKLYPLKTTELNNDTFQLEWNKVKSKYQGIIIAPYQWGCRLALETCWYYGWDCASGCIWDLSCIDEFKLME